MQERVPLARAPRVPPHHSKVGRARGRHERVHDRKHEADHQRDAVVSLEGAQGLALVCP